MKRIALFLVIVVMLIHIGIQIETYRKAVLTDTNTYLECREYYHNKAWQETDALKQEYSQRMCHDKWRWWNIEVYSKKIIVEP